MDQLPSTPYRRIFDISFESLGVARFSAAFDAARLTAPALVKLFERSARTFMDDIVSFLYAELDIDVNSCEWICQKIVASQQHDAPQNLRRDTCR